MWVALPEHYSNLESILLTVAVAVCASPCPAFAVSIGFRFYGYRYLLGAVGVEEAVVVAVHCQPCAVLPMVFAYNLQYLSTCFTPNTEFNVKYVNFFFVIFS